MSNEGFKRYLGDGVYADYDGYHIVLTTENGITTTNTIALEPPVMEALKRYEKRLSEIVSARRAEEEGKEEEPSGESEG
ncbi:MAG: hypothetical protein JSW58_08615 [Candidatus Latescibacterota bacterium]|nr:MAG: hypothetical protein JSW58_08615 [Candidatus Latescibacterota bacterium]